MKYYISRYAHFLNYGESVVFVNSLYLKPLIASSDELCIFNRLCSNGMVDSEHISEDIQPFFDELINHKILLSTKEKDDIVLNRIKGTIIKPVPTVVYFIVSEKCNFDCKYCFINDSLNSTSSEKKMMTKEVAKAGWDLFKKLTIDGDVLESSERYIVIYGGEPLTNLSIILYLSDLIIDDVKNGIIPYPVNITMNTNGSLLTESVIREMNKRNIQLAISIDGDRCSNLDRVFINGDETFDIVDGSICRARELDSKISLSITITNKTLENQESTIGYIKSTGIKSIGFNLLMPNSSSDYKNTENYSEESTSFLIKSYKELSKYGVYEDRIMRKIKALYDHEIYLHDCAATGGSQIVIEPSGDIGICQGLVGNKEFRLGSVFKGLDFSNNSITIEWSKRSPIFFESCQKCRALGICGGGCPKNSINKYGSIYRVDETFCFHTKAIFDWMMNELCKSKL